MAGLLSEYTGSRDNNFNLIRFLAATMVLFSHCYPLTGNNEDPLAKIIGFSFGYFAIDIFFVISGFLVMGSLLRCKKITAFIRARILRIYPALIAAGIFCVFVVGLSFTNLRLDSYLKNSSIYEFLLYNSTIIKGVRYYLPGVFETNPCKGSVNGSLWSIPWEVRMYFLLTIYGFIAYIKPDKIGSNILKLLVFLSAFFLICVNLINNSWPVINSQYNVASLRVCSMFFAGACLYILRDRIVLNKKFFITICVLLFFSAGNKKIFSSFYNLAICYIVLYIAYIPAGLIRYFNKAGDYSYGIYIYAFPVQQSVAAVWTGVSPGKMFVLSFPITMCCAILSWHLIEKPFLKRKGV